MFLKRTKIISLAIVIVFVLGVLSGCSPSGKEADSQSTSASAVKTETGDQTGTTPEPVTLKVLENGDKPNDWDKILEEFYARTKDTLNITFDWTWASTADYKDKLNVKMTAGEEYDLVFDAPWMNLRTLAEDGIYADLSPYLNNDKYPGLKKSFPEEIMNYNKYSGINCALPLFFTYGDINIVLYRMDWAKEFGVGTDGQLNSHEELKQYLQAVQDNETGVTPMALKDNRGFYHLFEAITADLSKEHIYQGSLGQDIFFAVKLNDAETEVTATALPGDSAKYWEPFGGVDFWKQKVENAREWNKFCETDSLNQKDPGSLFQIGKAGACIDTVDAVPKFNRLLTGNVPEAKLGVYVYDEAARSMEKGVLGAVVNANNCLAVPASSPNIDRTMEFLNWIFESPENHDLFEYGIEGANWEAVGDRQYTTPEGVNAATNYNPSGWNLTWTPEYYRFSSDYTDYSLPYAEYATELDNFRISNLTGFVFQSDSVKTEITQNGAILGQVLTPLNHGILENPYQVLQDTTAKLRQSKVQVAIDEYVRQLNEFLQNKK